MATVSGKIFQVKDGTTNLFPRTVIEAVYGLDKTIADVKTWVGGTYLPLTGGTLNRNTSAALGIDSAYKIGTGLRTLHIVVPTGSGTGLNDGYADGITFGTSAQTHAGIYVQSSGNYGTRMIFGTTTAYASGAYGRAIITSSGYVGIGTMSPSYLLDVNGSARVKGQSRFADTMEIQNGKGIDFRGTGGSILASGLTANLYNGLQWNDQTHTRLVVSDKVFPVTSAFDANNMIGYATTFHTSNGDIGSNAASWDNFPTGVPSGGFSLLSVMEGGYRKQFYTVYNNNRLYMRSQYYNSGKVWTDWVEFYTTANFNPNNYLTTSAAASTYVTALGTNGNYLTWTKDGTANNITVPYATLSGSSNWLNQNNTLAFGKSGLQYFSVYGTEGTSPTANNTPTAGWHHILRMNHSDSRGYFADIDVNLNGEAAVYWRRVVAGTSSSWFTFLDSNNFASIIGTTTYAPYNSAGYLPLSGGTLTSTNAAPLIINRNGGGDFCSIEYKKSSSLSLGWMGIYNTRGPVYSPDYSNFYKIYHSGNANLSTVPWACSTLTASGDITTSGKVIVGTGGSNGSAVGSDAASNIYLANSAGAPLVADGLVVRRGASATNGQLGNTTYRWANIYSVKGDFSDKVTVSGGVEIGHSNEINGVQSGAYTQNIHLNYRSTGYVSLCNGGGNVGIGTLAPSARLQIASPDYSYMNTRLSGSAIYFDKLSTNATGFHNHLSFRRLDASLNVVEYVHLLGTFSSSAYVCTYIAGSANNNSAIRIDGYGTSATVSVGYTGGGSYKLNVSGVIYSTTGIFSNGYVSALGTASSSDAKLKDDITTISYDRAKEVLSALNPREWTWNALTSKEGERGAGMVAQEVEPILPDTVKEIGGNLTLEYNTLFAYGLAMTKYLVPAVESLEERVARLERENEELKRQLTN